MAERFINAAKDGYVDLLREATRKDLNTPDEDGRTATLWAAHNGNLEALRLIVGREGDVDKADYFGMTALHLAAMRGQMGVVSYLVHWGCNVFALDNELHSALDVAAMYERHDIVRFLDADVAQRQTKNPRQVTKLKEEAMKAAENNIKRYDRLQEKATKRAEKDKIRMDKERELQFQQNGENGENTHKRSFFKTLTLRIKGGPGSNNGETLNSLQASKYSEYAGLTVSGKQGGIAKIIQRKRLESLTPNTPGGRPDFGGGAMDNSRGRSIRSMNSIQGYKGSTAEVLYTTAADQMSNSYKAKSESELLDSGIDSINDEEEDEENSRGIFNRPAFGKMAFLPKTHVFNTLQSFDDSVLPTLSNGLNGEANEEEGEEAPNSGGSHHVTSKQALPWDQDELGNLDDDEEDREISELSAVNMFLWSCGLASYLHIFSQEKIDMPLLTNMTDSELKELGLPFGPRKKLRDAIARRKTVLEEPTIMTDTNL